MYSAVWPRRMAAWANAQPMNDLPAPVGNTTDCIRFHVVTGRGAKQRRFSAAEVTGGDVLGSSGFKWTLLDLVDEHLNAGRELLAHVEAARSLTVVPVVAIPIRPMPRSGRRALLAGGFATPHVLLSVDDPIWAPGPTAQIGATCLRLRHTKSLHKSRSLEGKLPGEVGW